MIYQINFTNTSNLVTYVEAETLDEAKTKFEALEGHLVCEDFPTYESPTVGIVRPLANPEEFSDYRGNPIQIAKENEESYESISNEE